MPVELSSTTFGVWLALILAALAAIAQAAPKILGGFGTALKEREERKIARQKANEDADVADLKRQVANLQESVDRAMDRATAAEGRAERAEQRAETFRREAAWRNDEWAHLLIDWHKWAVHAIEHRTDPSVDLLPLPPLTPYSLEERG